MICCDEGEDLQDKRNFSMCIFFIHMFIKNRIANERKEENCIYIYTDSLIKGRKTFIDLALVYMCVTSTGFV